MATPDGKVQPEYNCWDVDDVDWPIFPIGQSDVERILFDLAPHIIVALEISYLTAPMARCLSVDGAIPN